MTMKSTVTTIATMVKDILQREGVVSLLRRGFAFMRQYFFQYGTFYVYEHTMKERNEADFLPKIQNFTVHIVHTNQQADELEADGFEFRSSSIHARRNLDKGAIAFCIFVESELAHIGWVAMTEEAKSKVDPLPFQINFSNKEACVGATLTILKYRGKGLMVYGYYKRFEFLRENGITTSRNAAATRNIASQKAHARFSPKIHSKARYLKILRWQFCREIPVVLVGHQD